MIATFSLVLYGPYANCRQPILDVAIKIGCDLDVFSHISHDKGKPTSVMQLSTKVKGSEELLRMHCGCLVQYLH
jgi:hypothetical protein